MIKNIYGKFKAGALYPLLISFFLFGCSGSDKNKNNDSDNQTKNKELVIVSYGGSYQEAQRKAFFEPFEKKYDVTIYEDSLSGDLSKIKTMISEGNADWDVISLETPLFLEGASQNLFERIDSGLFNPGNFLDGAINDYGIASCTWSTVLAYNSDEYGIYHQPQSWADFWNTDQFNGPRSLRNSPVSTLEFALMADGVSMDNLYPLDVDRAFKSLDKIKNRVKVWWDDGEQPIDLLSSGEVAMASAWNGRIYNARKANKPVKLSWEGGLIDMDWWAISKGSENSELAMKFIEFASEAGQQAEFSKYIPYGPTNLKALDLIPEEIQKNLPTSPMNLENQVFINSAWWFENIDSVEVKWNNWMSN